MIFWTLIHYRMERYESDHEQGFDRPSPPSISKRSRLRRPGCRSPSARSSCGSWSRWLREPRPTTSCCPGGAGPARHRRPAQVALSAMVARHDALRSRIRSADGSPYQVIDTARRRRARRRGPHRRRPARTGRTCAGGPGLPDRHPLRHGGRPAVPFHPVRAGRAGLRLRRGVPPHRDGRLVERRGEQRPRRRLRGAGLGPQARNWTSPR